MAKKKERSYFVVPDAQRHYYRHFNTIADGEKSLSISPKVINKVLEGIPVTKGKAMQFARGIWHLDRESTPEPADLVKDVRVED